MVGKKKNRDKSRQKKLKKRRIWLDGVSRSKEKSRSESDAVIGRLQGDEGLYDIDEPFETDDDGFDDDDDLISPRPPVRPMTFDTEKMMQAMTKLLEGKDFKNENEMDEYLQKMSAGKTIDEIIEIAGGDNDPVLSAQELAYQAVETENPLEAKRLASEALALNPNCIDALITMANIDSNTTEELLYNIKAIVEKAEDNFGEEYFNENMGHFWGLIETRPYMRALAVLSCSYFMCDKIVDAIRCAERMLQLNPNDNQGIRNSLMNYYLMLDEVEKFRRLDREYNPDDGNDGDFAVPNWCRVLERFVSNDIDGAKRVLKNARAKNRFVELYLTGKKKTPNRIVAGYALGSKEEAIDCFNSISFSWYKHPDAIKWLEEQCYAK